VRQPSTFVVCHIPHASPDPYVVPGRARCVQPCIESGGEGNRTPDLVNAIHALSQLSYAPEPLRPRRPAAAIDTVSSVPVSHRPTMNAVSIPRHACCGFSLSHTATARLLASDDDFATEPLNVSASLSGVNRRGLADFFSAGILHDFDDVRARAGEPALGCAAQTDRVGGASDVRSIIAGCRGSGIRNELFASCRVSVS
jgi:hypothetical protein